MLPKGSRLFKLHIFLICDVFCKKTQNCVFRFDEDDDNAYEAERQRHRLCKNHPDRIFGYVRCHIIPNTNDSIGLLPSHTDGKLLFDVRPKTGVWFTEEIYLAMRRGYTIQTIYEIFYLMQIIVVIHL